MDESHPKMSHFTDYASIFFLFDKNGLILTIKKFEFVKYHTNKCNMSAKGYATIISQNFTAILHRFFATALAQAREKNRELHF